MCNWCDAGLISLAQKIKACVIATSHPLFDIPKWSESICTVDFMDTHLLIKNSLRLGDYLPDKLAIHLPSSMTVKGIFDRMCEELITTTSLVSQAQFYNLWKEYYPHVTIPTVSVMC